MVVESCGVVEDATAPALIIASREANTMLIAISDFAFNVNRACESETVLIKLPAKTRKSVSLSRTLRCQG